MSMTEPPPESESGSDTDDSDHEAGRSGNGSRASAALGAVPPGVGLAGLLDAAAGTGDRYAGLGDGDVLAGVERWNALESWAAARKLAGIGELIRRNPEGGYAAAEPGGLPAAWRRDLCEEIACELAVSRAAADKLAGLAHDLAGRLPLTAQALLGGVLDLSKARLIAQETSVLSDADARAAEAVVARWWAGKTWSQLQKKIAAAVVNIDPEGAEKRREQAAREDARVRFWRERSGNCGMGAYELPADQALLANQNIQRRARQYKAWGIPFGMDLLRVMAFLDLVNAADSRTQYPKGGQAGSGPASPDQDTLDSDGPDGDGKDSDSQDGSEPDGQDGPDGGGPDDDGPDDDGSDEDGPDDEGGPDGDGPAGDGSGPGDQGLAANVDLTIPLMDLLGLAQRAGEAHGLGVLDAGLARQLAASAARNPASSFTIIITDPSGHAIGYGHLARKRRPGAARPPAPGQQGQLWPEHSQTRPDNCTVTFTPAGPSPAAGYGTWTLTIGDLELTVTIDPIPGEAGCEHRDETAGYRPSAKLRRLVEIRDGECTLPVCVRHPRSSEWEHTIPWPQGRTCSCNGAMRCKHDHRIKEKWEVKQLPGGYHQWTGPSRRTYTKGPRQYPI
jgi:uncharacterized protein DUF222